MSVDLATAAAAIGYKTSAVAAAAHVTDTVLTSSKNCSMTNPATGVYKFTFTAAIPAGCVPIAAATFDAFADETGMVCTFSRNSSRSDDVTWINSITVQTRRHSDMALLAPKYLKLIMLDPTH